MDDSGDRINFTDSSKRCLNFELPFEQLDAYLELLRFGEDQLFHDTFYEAGKSRKNGHEIWLRRRRNLSCRESPPFWLLSERWGDQEHTLLYPNDSRDGIARVLDEHGISFDEEKELEDMFPKYLMFRFYRRDAETTRGVVVHIDETLLGYTLSAKVSAGEEEEEEVVRLTQKHQLKKASSKLVSMKIVGPVSAHLCGFRSDVLLESDEDVSSDEEFMREWLADAHSRRCSPPPEGPCVFEHDTPESRFARQLFDEICGPKAGD